MSGPDRTRLRKELEKLTDWDISGVDASPVGDDLTHLSGRIRGPKDTPYEGGIFGVDIQIPRDYPFAPPKMKFTTSLWHPNVSSQTGAICLDILKVGTGSAWSPALTIKTALLSLQALLSAPEPNDPQDAQVASQYKKDYKQWCATAKYWTEIHAMGPTAAAQARAAGGAASGAGATSSAAATAPKEPPITDPKLKTLIEMGFDRKKAEAALGAKKGNVEAALEYLFATA